MFLLPAVLMGQSTVSPAPPAKSTTAAPNAKIAPTSAPKSAVAAKATAPATDEQKTVYALGLQMHRSLAQFDLSPAEVEPINRALGDASAVLGIDVACGTLVMPGIAS